MCKTTRPLQLTTLLVAVLSLSPSAPGAEPAPPATIPGALSHVCSSGTNRLHYLTAGQGEAALVFVHCWAGNSGFWRDQVPPLTNHARLILVDLPGHGRSDKPQVPYTMDFFADAVLAVMKDAQVDQATLLGHSMGVAVTCRVAQKAPDKVRALVAVDGLLRRPALAAEQVEQFIGPFRGAGYREHTREFIGSMFPNAGTESLRDQVLADILQTPQHVMSGAMDGMFGAGQPDWDLKRVSFPVLVINTSNPMWTDDYQAYVRGLSPNSAYRTLEGAGHWLMIEKPVAFNTELTRMLTEFSLIAKHTPP